MLMGLLSTAVAPASCKARRVGSLASAVIISTGIVAGERRAAQALQHFQTVDVRQRNIQQNQLRPMLCGQVQAQLAWHARQQLYPRPALQQGFDQRQAGEVVFDAQHVALQPGKRRGQGASTRCRSP